MCVAKKDMAVIDITPCNVLVVVGVIAVIAKWHFVKRQVLTALLLLLCQNSVIVRLPS